MFGWEYDDNPIDDGQASADEATTRAGEQGATVMMEPFDVMDIGRMSVIVDPTGAALCLWEPRGVIGATLVNVPGAMTWNDLVTPDPDAAVRFYGTLFGWTVEEIPDAGGYRVIRNGKRAKGGMVPLDPERMGADTPPNWMPYCGHEDVDRLVEEVATSAGGCSTARSACPRAPSRSWRIRRARCSPCGPASTRTSCTATVWLPRRGTLARRAVPPLR